MTMTPKQKLFAQEYLVDLNATQAAIRAGYSKKTARKIGQENLTKPDIAKEIEKGKGERAAGLRFLFLKNSVGSAWDTLNSVS